MLFSVIESAGPIDWENIFIPEGRSLKAVKCMIDGVKKQAVNGAPTIKEAAPRKVKPPPKSPSKRKRPVKKDQDKSGILVADDEEDVPLIKKHKSDDEDEGEALEFIKMENGHVDDGEEDNEEEA